MLRFGGRDQGNDSTRDRKTSVNRASNWLPKGGDRKSHGKQLGVVMFGTQRKVGKRSPDGYSYIRGSNQEGGRWTEEELVVLRTPIEGSSGTEDTTNYGEDHNEGLCLGFSSKLLAAEAS